MDFSKALSGINSTSILLSIMLSFVGLILYSCFFVCAKRKPGKIDESNLVRNAEFIGIKIDNADERKEGLKINTTVQYKGILVSTIKSPTRGKLKTEDKH